MDRQKLNVPFGGARVEVEHGTLINRFQFFETESFLPHAALLIHIKTYLCHSSYKLKDDMILD